MSHPFSRRRLICKALLWANVASDNEGEALWAAHSPQPFASWLFPSVNKFGPSTSTNSTPSNHHLFIKHIRYVNNRLIFGDSRLQQLPPYEVLLPWKAHHPGNGTWPRVSWFHAWTSWNQAFGTHLPRPHQHLPGPVTILGIPTKSSSQWLSISLPHRRQGWFPRLPSPARPGSINPLIYFAGFPNEELHTISSQILTQHQNLQLHEKIHWPLSLCRVTFCFLLSSGFSLVVLVPVVFLPGPPCLLL